MNLRQKNCQVTRDILRLCRVYNSWVVGYAEVVIQVGIKIFKCQSEIVSNEHVQVDFAAFSI